MQIYITMKFERATKNTFRYKEILPEFEAVAEPVIGTMYIRKSAMKGSQPTALTVTIEAEEV